MNYKYPNEPQWIVSSTNTKCSNCYTKIKRGNDAYYFPLYQKIYCDVNDCGFIREREENARIARQFKPKPVGVLL